MIYGYARSSMTTEEFRDKIGASLTCRIDWDRAGGSSCAEKTEEFVTGGFSELFWLLCLLCGWEGDEEGGLGEDVLGEKSGDHFLKNIEFCC